MTPRTYVNLEKAQIETILALFKEIDDRRGLRAVEKFISIIFKNALDESSMLW